MFKEIKERYLCRNGHTVWADPRLEEPECNECGDIIDMEEWEEEDDRSS